VDGGIEQGAGLAEPLEDECHDISWWPCMGKGCTQISCLKGALSGIIGIWTCSGRHVEIDARAVWLSDEVASIIQ